MQNLNEVNQFIESLSNLSLSSKQVPSLSCHNKQKLQERAVGAIDVYQYIYIYNIYIYILYICIYMYIYIYVPQDIPQMILLVFRVV